MLSEEEQKNQARNHNAVIPPCALIPHTGCTSGRRNTKAFGLIPLAEEVPRPPVAAIILLRKKITWCRPVLTPFPRHLLLTVQESTGLKQHLVCLCGAALLLLVYKAVGLRVFTTSASVAKTCKDAGLHTVKNCPRYIWDVCHASWYTRKSLLQDICLEWECQKYK